MIGAKLHKASPWWLPALLVAGSLTFAYWDTIQALVNQWFHDDDYSHGFLVVPIAVYLAWQRRYRLKGIEIGTDWRALPLLLFAVAVFVVGELGAELFTTRVSMLVFVIGLTWFLFGASVVKNLAFPLAFLFLMLPLPGFIYRNITFPLQLIASVGAVNLLQTLGITAFREGNVIDVGFMQLQVVEACSGLRYILPLLTFGVLFAYFGQKVFWKRLILVLATVPAAIVANISRVAGTGWIGTYWGSEAAEGFFHSFSGWVVFMFCIALFSSLNLLLRPLPGKGRMEKPPTAPLASVVPTARVSWLAAVIGMLVILVSPSVVSSLGNVPPVPLTRPLNAFPLDFQGWVGQRSEIDSKVWNAVGGQDYVLIDYRKANRGLINFYVAYYEYQRKAGDFVHSPRLCLPGAGWFIEMNHVRILRAHTAVRGQSVDVHLNELVIEKGGARQLVYFWYQGRGRNFTSEFAAKFYMVWDGIWRRRTDGALVRLVMPLHGGLTLVESRRILDSFAMAARITLEDYLP
ncbi:MAG: VPLPA-CTERM-specific exosortase XrtD [Deltaproteobacteria bacterium]|nr:VPLPA-CTERM-specific exosortase XrtD [Deltaproteobacteria bacterium]